MECPYCNSKVEIKSDSVVYGENGFNRMIYICSNYPKCNSYVGINKKTGQPLGTLADKKLRFMRMNAHNIFDRIWKEFGFSRTAAYNLLQKIMKLDKNDTHIGKFNIGQCEKCIMYFQKLIFALMNINQKIKNINYSKFDFDNDNNDLIKFILKELK